MACNENLFLDTSPSVIRLVIPKGSDYGWNDVTMTDEDDVAIDVTGATFEGGIKQLYNDTVYLVAVDAEVVDGPAGEFRWRFIQADIDALNCGESITDTESQYVWTFAITLATLAVTRLYKGPVFIVA